MNRVLPRLALLAGLLLAGCSAPAAPTPTPSATASVSVAPGVSWPGTGYVLTMPVGSVEVTDAMKQQLADDPAAEDIEIVGSAPEGLPVVMTLRMAGAASEMDVEAYKAGQRETGLTDVRDVAPVTLDGRRADGVLGGQPDGLQSLSYLVAVDDDLVVLMFLGPDADAMQPIVDYVVGAFRWS